MRTPVKEHCDRRFEIPDGKVASRSRRLEVPEAAVQDVFGDNSFIVPHTNYLGNDVMSWYSPKM